VDGKDRRIQGEIKGKKGDYRGGKKRSEGERRKQIGEGRYKARVEGRGAAVEMGRKNHGQETTLKKSKNQDERGRKNPGAWNKGEGKAREERKGHTSMVW
jgi:hypothetical protein